MERTTTDLDSYTEAQHDAAMGRLLRDINALADEAPPTETKDVLADCPKPAWPVAAD